ncbi:hypothetical protein Bca4012_037485 [Brassica carinata]
MFLSSSPMISLTWMCSESLVISFRTKTCSCKLDRGTWKLVVCEAVIREENVLKTSVAALVELNMLKNLTCTAVAGSLGGFSADSRSIGFNVFIATCQDPTQNVESSQCITVMEAINGKYIHISITTPSIEVETVGGGTHILFQ